MKPGHQQAPPDALKPGFEFVQIRAGRRLLADRPEFDEIGEGREPEPLAILLVDDGDDWEEELSFADALGYLEHPPKLWEFCARTSTDSQVLEDRIRWAVEQWQSLFSEVELHRFGARQKQMVEERADVAEALLRAGERHLELDVLTTVALERRGWVGLNGRGPIPPEGGEG